MLKPIYILLFIMLLSTVSLSGNNIFRNTDSFKHALDSANINNKLLVSYASRPVTPCCIAMRNATFDNQKVKNLLNNNFYPVQVNLSTSAGQEWIDRFQIVNTPTLLFFDQHGTLIKQVEECLSSTELIVILEEVLFYQVHGFWSMEPAHPVVLTAYVPENSASVPISSNNQSVDVRRQQNNKQVPKIQILLNQMRTDDPSARSVFEEVKRMFPQHPLSIKLTERGQNHYYQLWIGNFSECREASAFMKILNEQGFDNAQLTCTP